MNANTPIRRRAKVAAIGSAALVATLALATSVVAATHHTHVAKAARATAVTTITFRAHEVIKPKLYDIAKPAGPSIGGRDGSRRKSCTRTTSESATTCSDFHRRHPHPHRPRRRPPGSPRAQRRDDQPPRRNNLPEDPRRRRRRHRDLPRHIRTAHHPPDTQERRRHRPPQARAARKHAVTDHRFPPRQAADSFSRLLSRPSHLRALDLANPSTQARAPRRKEHDETPPPHQRPRTRRRRHGRVTLERQRQQSQTIKFALAYHDAQVDLGQKGPSLGDERIFADTLLDAKGKKVGHDAGVCTFTSLAPPEAACQITFFLPGGEVSTQFLNAPPPRKLAAIVGGTGTYRGAAAKP